MHLDHVTALLVAHNNTCQAPGPATAASMFGKNHGPELAELVRQGHTLEELAAKAGIEPDATVEWATHAENGFPNVSA